VLSGREKEEHYTRKALWDNRALTAFGFFPAAFFRAGRLP
jgi:hypothetical protein